MGQETEFRKLRGFGDTNFALLGQSGDVESPGVALPEALFALDVQGETERCWRVQRFTVTEELSTLYEGVIDIASESFTDNPDLMLGRYALLQVQRDNVLRRFYGLVRRVEQRGTTGTSRLARIHLVPALWTLSQRSDSRVFQNVTAVEVVQAVLQEAGLYLGMLQLMLTREYPRREYCVQYRETDLAFVMRLLESEGITFFFRHDDDGTEVLVLTDGAHAWQSLRTMDGGPIPIAGSEMNTHRVEAVRHLTWEREQRPARVAVRDFDFTRPDFKIEAVFPRRPTADTRALYEPAPGLAINRYEGATYTDDDAKEQAQLRHEAEQVPGAMGRGEALVTGMMPGLSFALTLAGGHIPPQRYLVTRVEHTGDAQEELVLASEREALGQDRYHNRFVSTLVETPFRPARRTPRPVIAGIETATVTGPSGEEVYADEHGRIKVQFHWDRRGERNERSSCWLRAMQGPWSGGGWGFQFLPRVGMEVVVSFVEGDPDRPVILGTLYNGRNVPPFELPGQRNRSGVRTQTVGGHGHNELSFDDTAGGEQVYLHAQRNLDAVVENDRTSLVRHHDTSTVQGDIRVTGERDAEVRVREGLRVASDRLDVATERDHRVTVGRDHHHVVERSHFSSVSESVHQHVDGNHTRHVAGYASQYVGMDSDVTVQGDALESVWGDRSVEVMGDFVQRSAGAHAVHADGDAAMTSRKAFKLKASSHFVIECGQSVIEMTPEEIVLRSPKISVEARDALSLDARKTSLDFDDGKARLTTAKEVELFSDAVRVYAKDSTAELTKEGVTLSAKKTVELQGKGAALLLDEQATVRGAKVKLVSGGATKGTFKNRIGLPDLDEDAYVLARQLLSPGGQPLAFEYVNVIDPDTDEVVAGPVQTNEKGELRVEVPEGKEYDLQIVPDDFEEAEQPDDHEVHTKLHATFVNHRGEALVGRAVNVRGAVSLELTTSESGEIDALVPPGPYELEIGDDVFNAHASREAHVTREGSRGYVFVVEPEWDDALEEDVRAHRDAAHEAEHPEHEEV